MSADDERDLRARLGLSRPFVMYSGGSDPRKNLDRLIQAYAGLPPPVRQAHHLVLVGKMHQTRAEALQATARAAGLGPEDVRITDYAEDEDLVRLYNLCTLFVLPSVHEGFGMPALEAMSCGAPVVGSNTSSLPEVIGWPEAMFDPLDVAAMTARMERALTDDAFRAELIARGARRAEAFSWDESARRAIAAFERIHARHAERQVRRTVASEVAVARLVGDVRGIPGKPADRDLIATARAIAINHPKKRRRRLIVDVSYLIGRGYGTGIHRVVRSMITWLPSVLPAGYRMELAYATVDNPYRRARWDRPEHGMGRVATTTVVLDPRPGDVFLGLDLAQRIVAAQAGFYAELRRLGIPVSFVVYDLLPLFLPHRFPPEVEDVHRRWLEVVAAADGAICISGAVADELRSWVEIHGRDRRRPLRIGSFHLGADIEATDHTSGLPDDAAETLQVLAARPTFLLVGTLEPRKGHVQTLDAFERLWNDEVDVNLVLVGKAGWHMEPFLARLNGHPEMGKRLYWLESASDDYLDAIYRAASCLIAPSEGEGFGLPLIEAAQHGTPLLVRDIPVFREVAGDHASYFDGADAASLADAVRAWLSSWQQGLHPRSDDMPWLTWQESARQLVTVLFDGSL